MQCLRELFPALYYPMQSLPELQSLPPSIDRAKKMELTLDEFSQPANYSPIETWTTVDNLTNHPHGQQYSLLEFKIMENHHMVIMHNYLFLFMIQHHMMISHNFCLKKIMTFNHMIL